MQAMPNPIQSTTTLSIEKPATPVVQPKSNQIRSLPSEKPATPVVQPKSNQIKSLPSEKPAAGM